MGEGKRMNCELEDEGDGGVMFHCPRQAMGKWRGRWWCQEHLDEQMDIDERLSIRARQRPGWNAPSEESL